MGSFAHIPITSRATSLEAVFVVQEEKHMLIGAKFLGPVVRKPISANRGLKVIQRF